MWNFVNSYLWFPLLTLNSNMPIVSKGICDKISIGRNWWITYRNAIIAKWFYFIFSSMVPKMHSTISTTGWKPFLILRMEINWIYWKQCNSIFLLCFVGFECYMVFLNKLNIYLPSYIHKKDLVERKRYSLFHLLFPNQDFYHLYSTQ